MADAALSLDGTTAKANAVAAHGSHRRRGPMRWVVLAILVILLLGTLFPFFLAIINAVKTGVDYAANGPLSLPTTIDFSALVKFWNLSDFTRKLANSVII